MYRDVLQSISGIGIFPAVSLVLFVLVFTLAVAHAWRIDGHGARRMAALPLDELDTNENLETSR